MQHAVKPARSARHVGPTGGQNVANATSTRRYGKARLIGAYVPSITAKAVDKLGYSTVALIADWETVAGRAFAAVAVPVRLTWPRKTHVPDSDADLATGRQGASLVLKVNPARALEIEYGRQQLIERINAYFGYRAVERLKLVQDPTFIAATNVSGGSINQPSYARKPSSQAAQRASGPAVGTMDQPAVEETDRTETSALTRALDRLKGHVTGERAATVSAASQVSSTVRAA
ncbi:MAG: DciA family protein [Pseudomonadota bacterium]